MALAKEGLSGTLMGCMLGCGIFSFSFMYPGFEPKVALTVAVSLPVSSKKVMRENMKNLMLRLFCFSKKKKNQIISLWANVLGVALPLVAQKLRLNPAVTAAPLMTTIVDATGLLIYFFIAKYIIGSDLWMARDCILLWGILRQQHLESPCKMERIDKVKLHFGEEFLQTSSKKVCIRPLFVSSSLNSSLPET